MSIDTTTETGAAPAPAARELGWLGSRIVRGLREAPTEYRAWRLGTTYDREIELAHQQKDAKAALLSRTRQEDHVKRAEAKIRRLQMIGLGTVFGGCFWITLLLVPATIWLLVSLGVKDAAKSALFQSIATAGAVSLGLEMVNWLLGMHPSFGGAMWTPWMLSWPALALLFALVRLIIWVGPDGSITDNLNGEMVPAEVERDDRPQIVAAAMATGALPKGTEPRLVDPGVMPGNGGQIWTATLDTMGPSAEAFLPAKPRAELAARLGLSTRRLIITVDEDRGSRLHMIGITGDPLDDIGPSPLLTMPRVDLWRPFPFGKDVTGREITYTVPDVNSLFGGESGAGKSVAVFDVIAAFALSPNSKIYAIDGGEADTKVLYKTELATAWTSERPDAIKILEAVHAEVSRRQRLLGDDDGDDDDVRVSPALMAEHGFGFDLLIIDELASFTQDKSPDAKRVNELLLPIVQRARKTGVHLLLSTQSPSVDAIDPDARDVISNRWCGRARSVDLAGKVLGRGTVGRGVDPRNLPDVKGAGWLSGPAEDVVVRPYYLTRAERRAICLRGAQLRRGASSAAAPDESRRTVAAVAALIRAEGVTVPAGRVMRTQDVADRLGLGQLALRQVLAEHGIKTEIVRRTDDPSADNRSHLVLAAFPVARVG